MAIFWRMAHLRFALALVALFALSGCCGNPPCSTGTATGGYTVEICATGSAPYTTGGITIKNSSGTPIFSGEVKRNPNFLGSGVLNDGAGNTVGTIQHNSSTGTYSFSLTDQTYSPTLPTSSTVTMQEGTCPPEA